MDRTIHYHTIDRAQAARAMAKVIAYTNVGKREDAEKWFLQLAIELGMVNLAHSAEYAASVRGEDK